jgi:hypothetical protein
MYFYFEDDFEKDNYFEIVNYNDGRKIQNDYVQNQKNSNDLANRQIFSAIGEKSYIVSLLAEKLFV